MERWEQASNELCKDLRSRAQYLQMSDDDVADKVGVQAATIARVFDGKIKFPSMKLIVAIAEALECKLVVDVNNRM